MAPAYSSHKSTHEVLQNLFDDPGCVIPAGVRKYRENVQLVGTDTELPPIPVKWRHTESMVSLKLVEAMYALAIGHLRFPESDAVNGTKGESRTAQVDFDHATGMLMLAFLSEINGIAKLEPGSGTTVLDTDLNRAQSNPYRLSVTNMYQTKDGWFHFHGNLDATPTLDVLNLPPFREELTDFRECCKIVQEAAWKFTNEELMKRCLDRKIAGTPVYSREAYLKSKQGEIESKAPWLKVEKLESSKLPAKFPPGPQLLSGIKVLDLTRVIAGPLVGRTIAEYGASVLRVNNMRLPDASYYQVDLNYGKRTTDLDLKSEQGKQVFENLVKEADVIIDGYRPGSLEKLGFGPQDLLKLLKARDRGFVYLSENCHGWEGPYHDRSGWQQIADASTGVSWEHGVSWGKQFPIAPPFPMADYGCGEMGAIAILHGLYLRATEGGSYHCKVSLCGFNNMSFNQGAYSDEIWKKMMDVHGDDFNAAKLTYNSNFNDVGRAAITSVKKASPKTFQDSFYLTKHSDAFRGNVKSLKPVVQAPYKPQIFNRGTRCNGWDKPGWEYFETDGYDKE